MSTAQSYHHGNVPQATIEAAQALLQEMPAEQISMRELARAAGVSHGAPYKHFGDRHGFLVALAARCMADFLDAQQRALDGAPRGDRLLRVGEAYVHHGTAHPHAFALIFDTAISPPGHPPDLLGPLIDHHSQLLREAITDALDAGRLPSQIPVQTLASALWSQAHGLTELVITGRIPPTAIEPVLATFLDHATARPTG